ncbi:hypothetical protein [Streptomyces sp. FH025]|uniref:hypothetical protein n=1 Tax=Streptomyces sp. FH025 TaxID=2815937 RepID=UPI001A9D0DB5|nr:hypothetical protein [Streptomyces sp. FH025]MBO1413866.1 hypothetical protein [Streptomyces sp. FH025]
MRAVRLASTVVTAAVLLGGVTACGSKGGDGAKGGDSAAGALTGDPKAALAASAVVMQKAGNGKIDMASPGGSDHTSGKGTADWKDPGKPSADLTAQVEDNKQLRIRVIGADGYVGSDDVAALGGKHWIKLPAGNDLGDSMLAVGQMLNPVVQLTVAAQSGKLSKVGEETVDGVKTTHLRAVEDTSVLVGAMTGLSADQRKAVQKTLEDDGTSLTVDFWLNGKQELVQYKEYGDKNGEKEAVTIKYSDLGKADKIEAPAAGDLGSEADLLKLLS